MRVLLFFCAVSFSVSAAPQAELWDQWTSHDPDSTTTVDHQEWAVFLQRYLDDTHPSGVSRLRYSSVDAGDRQLLERYLSNLEAVAVSTLNRQEQFAYWVNAYNAATVQLILENMPVESIRDISDPWDQPVLRVEGTAVTLNDIEHRILRPIWRDPRIHYVVNCASYGCPDLPPDPLDPTLLEQQLDAAARSYVNHPRGATVDGNRLLLSSIYRWYRDDFGPHDEAVLEHLRRYANPDLTAALRDFDGPLRYRYDWSLNAP